ncbi:hypothetical protein [Saccharopolyspora sp. NPDC002376]
MPELHTAAPDGLRLWTESCGAPAPDRDADCNGGWPNGGCWPATSVSPHCRSVVGCTATRLVTRVARGRAEGDRHQPQQHPDHGQMMQPGGETSRRGRRTCDRAEHRDASEAGLSASAASAHLAKLCAGGLIEAERSGRHRYFRLVDDRVAAVLEALAAIAPTEPLRQGTRAAAVREARSCYDHLAGRLGVAVTAALLDRGALATEDGIPDTRRRPGDGLSVQLSDLGPHAGPVFSALGVDLQAVQTGPSRRPLSGSAWTGASSATTSPGGWAQRC